MMLKRAQKMKSKKQRQRKLLGLHKSVEVYLNLEPIYYLKMFNWLEQPLLNQTPLKPTSSRFSFLLDLKEIYCHVSSIEPFLLVYVNQL
jgi:hypothetical protein